MMLKKPTLIKIAVAVAVVLALIVVMKMAAPKREVIVTAMPMDDFVPAGYKDDDDDFEVVTTAPVKEGYAEYEQEGFQDYSSTDYKTDLLE